MSSMRTGRLPYEITLWIPLVLPSVTNLNPIAPVRCLSGSLILLASRSVFPSIIDLRRATFDFIVDFGLLISNSPAPSGVPTIMLLTATAVVLAIAIDRIGLLLHRLGYLRVHMPFVSRGGLEPNHFDCRYHFC